MPRAETIAAWCSGVLPRGGRYHSGDDALRAQHRQTVVDLRGKLLLAELVDVRVGLRMVRDLVPLGDDACDELGMLGRLVAHHEEGRVRALGLQGIEYGWCESWVRAVVEGQRDLALRSREGACLTIGAGRVEPHAGSKNCGECRDGQYEVEVLLGCQLSCLPHEVRMRRSE